MKMMEIKKIPKNDKLALNIIVDIHIKAFRGFFLTFMGKGFLKQVYSSYLSHRKSEVLGAFIDNRLVGFLAYSEDLSGLYKYMLKTRLIGIIWYSFGAFIRKPVVFFRLIRALLKPSESKREERYVKLASIGILPEEMSKGVGTALINALKNSIDFQEFSYISLETDAENNEKANRFYVKNGFALKKTFITREGRKMNEYRFCNENFNS